MTPGRMEHGGTPFKIPAMFLEEDNTVALLGWLNGTAWQHGVVELGLGSFTHGPASNRVSCFLVDRTEIMTVHTVAF